MRGDTVKTSEPLVVSEKLPSPVEAAMENFYRMRKLVIGVFFAHILLICFMHYPTVKKITLYSSLIFQITAMLLILPYFVCKIIRSMESCGDRFNKILFSLRIWIIGCILYGAFSISITLYLSYIPPSEGWEDIMRIIAIYCYMSCSGVWLWLELTVLQIRGLIRRSNASNQNGTQDDATAVVEAPMDIWRIVDDLMLISSPFLLILNVVNKLVNN